MMQIYAQKTAATMPMHQLWSWAIVSEMPITHDLQILLQLIWWHRWYAECVLEMISQARHSFLVVFGDCLRQMIAVIIRVHYFVSGYPIFFFVGYKNCSLRIFFVCLFVMQTLHELSKIKVWNMWYTEYHCCDKIHQTHHEKTCLRFHTDAMLWWCFGCKFVLRHQNSHRKAVYNAHDTSDYQHMISYSTKKRPIFVDDNA